MSASRSLVETALPAALTMPALSDAAANLARKALSPRTVRLNSDALAALKDWIAMSGRTRDDAALADYLAARHEAGIAPATLALTVAAVEAAARLSGDPSPAGNRAHPRRGPARRCRTWARPGCRPPMVPGGYRCCRRGQWRRIARWPP